MKKFVAMMVMVALVMSLAMAHAELRYEVSHVHHEKLGVKHDGTVVFDDRYYVKVTSEYGDTKLIEVSKDEYINILVPSKPAKESKPWHAKLASVVTFWNPND